VVSRFLRCVWRHLRSAIIAGLLVLAPLVATYLILRLIYNFLVSLVEPLTDLAVFQALPDLAVTWVSLGLLVVLLYVLGILATKVLGGRIVNVAHQIVETIPGVRAIYRIARQAIEMLSGTNCQTKFSRVVFVDFPRKGLRTIGLVTGRLEDESGRPILMLYIPTAPNPTSGFTALVFEEEVASTDISVEDAMRLVVSGGAVFPEGIGRYASEGPLKERQSGKPEDEEQE